MRVWLRIGVSMWLGGRGAPSSIVLVGMGVICIAVAVMVISVCVVAGFDRVINDKMAWLLGHVQVRAYHAGGLAWELPPVKYDSALVAQLSAMKGVRQVRPFYHKGALLVGKNGRITGVVLRGLHLTHHAFGSYWKAGDTSTLRVARKGVVISSEQSRALDIFVGDSVIVAVKRADGTMQLSRAPVLGIYSAGMLEYDKVVAFVPLHYLWALSGVKDELSGYEIVLEDWRLFPAVYREMEESLPVEMGIFTLRDLNPNLYDWLELHATNKKVLLILLMAVVVVGLSSIGIVTVLENASRLSILWALGARNWQVGVVFFLAVESLLLVGMLAGDLLAFSLLFIQKFTGVVRLDENAYYVREVPVAFPVGELLTVHGIVVLVSILTMVVPIAILRRLKPAQLFRWHF